MIERELGTFLRNRRESVTPADVGLPEGAGRRTPGLRRAELATLAGVSIDYLIRLEQGRDTRPSPRVLSALGDALRLSDDDLDRLRTLSTLRGDAGEQQRARAAARTVRPTVRALLTLLEPSPAVVVNHLSDLLVWTVGFDQLVRPTGLLDVEEPNLLRYTFTDDRSHAFFPDWERVADSQVATLRAEVRRPGGDTHALADQLTDVAGTAFSDRWDRVGMPVRRSGVVTAAHPEVGVLRLAFETLELSDPDRQRLMIYLPADSVTEAGLDRLTGRQPGRLHAVSAG